MDSQDQLQPSKLYSSKMAHRPWQIAEAKRLREELEQICWCCQHRFGPNEHRYIDPLASSPPDPIFKICKHCAYRRGEELDRRMGNKKGA